MLSASITLYPRETQGEISPFLHGQSLEHTGEGITPGVWVGENDEIPHQNGIRTGVLDALRQLEPPVLRWPGSRFADAYNWRDGVGPRETRPRRVSTRWGVDEIDSNGFGTHEFLRLCREVGAQAWLGGNVGSAAPRDLAHWVEYCNFGGATTLADARGKNGDPQAFGVQFWGIGSQSWDCGGKFTPETYAAKYRQFESAFPRFAGQNPFLIAVGPDGGGHNSASWTRQTAPENRRGQCSRVDGLDAHYSIANTQNQFGTATAFTLDEYYGMLSQGLQVEKLIDEQRSLLDASPAGRDAKLIVGEWGVQHAAQERHLWQPNTLRDAICAAMTLDLFHRKCKVLWMANLAQGVNVMQSLLHTFGEVTVRTPTFHVFDLYKRHRGGQLLHADFESGEAGGLPRLSGSASYQNGVVTLSVVNSGARSPVEATVELPGSNLEIVAAKELTGESWPRKTRLKHPKRWSHAKSRPNSIPRHRSPALSTLSRPLQ
jgi:alpha-N-arabinofuranosidase